MTEPMKVVELEIVLKELLYASDVELKDDEKQALEQAISMLKELEAIKAIECELPEKAVYDEDECYDYDCTHNKGWCMEIGYNKAINDCEPIVRKLKSENEQLRKFNELIDEDGGDLLQFGMELQLENERLKEELAALKGKGAT